jgi:hypothetical protein
MKDEKNIGTCLARGGLLPCQELFPGNSNPLWAKKNKNFSIFKPCFLVGEVISYFILHTSAFN